MPTTTGSGQIIMGSSDTPGVVPVPAQQISGSIAQAAAAKTASDQVQQVAAFKNLGAGQKGSSRKRKGRGRRMRGGNDANNVQPSTLPSAGSIPGVSPTNVGKGLAELGAQIKASAAYDKLTTAQPQIVGGFLLRGSEEMYPASGTQEDTKRTRKTKKKHGRRHKRTHRRKRSRTHPVRRRRSRRA